MNPDVLLIDDALVLSVSEIGWEHCAVTRQSGGGGCNP